MARVTQSAMMFATVSGCAQSACVRVEKSDAKATGKPSAKATGRRAKRRTKPGRGAGKPS